MGAVSPAWMPNLNMRLLWLRERCAPPIAIGHVYLDWSVHVYLDCDQHNGETVQHSVVGRAYGISVVTSIKRCSQASCHRWPSNYVLSILKPHKWSPWHLLNDNWVPAVAICWLGSMAPDHSQKGQNAYRRQ